MPLTPFNSYEDKQRAEAYARLEFPGTYYLAYRDLPKLFSQYVIGNKAIDFGCGTGRSTRYLKKYGFENPIGIDISQEMIKKAYELDPDGDYRLIKDGDFSQFEENSFDLVLSTFTFDNIPTAEKKIALFKGLKKLLNENGKIISVVSSPEIYLNEWESFSTKDYPENKFAKSGDVVRIIITGIGDSRPVEDIVWTPEFYLEVYNKAGLKVVEKLKPLAMESEPYDWVNETNIAPWTIYVLKKSRF